ncbi:MAG TPA: hypothetical protein VNG51_24350 [Ktedonobacteraceae bacterium]|nr:hypothetical protein [Ktedonobacteraceae bacterium]
MHEQELHPNKPQYVPTENEIVTCRFQEHGEQVNYAVRIVQVFTEHPFAGYLFVEMAQNPGVFTYSHVNNIVQATSPSD